MTRRVLHTYLDGGYELREPIESPFTTGDTVVIPKGTWVRRMGRKDSGLTKRQLVVKIHYSNPGYLSTTNRYRRLVTVDPELTWAGSGGYWARCNVTDELLRANNIHEDDLVVNVNNLLLHRFELEDLK